MKAYLIAAAALCGFAFGTPALAYDWSVVAKVTSLEASYMPISLDFTVDHAGGSCAAGGLLAWAPQGPDTTSKATNAQAIYSTLMSAELSGHTVTLYGTNSGCVVNYVYIN